MKRSKANPTALDVAKFFLEMCDVENAGDTISNLKMQKLVYYAQGVHLALKGERLFDENIEAWEHGPVVPNLYQELKRFGSREIVLDLEGFDRTVFSLEQQSLLKYTYGIYGRYSAFELRNRTHQELPWLRTTRSNTIDDEKIREYFKEQNDVSMIEAEIVSDRILDEYSKVA
ncbi:hypothetical protein AGMMS49521_2630 [Campylobacterota bacterium]|nr:hypothetical protein AGMMS49521_2630 [Campylobacterota bacterium]